jgi:hypothetical protein
MLLKENKYTTGLFHDDNKGYIFKCDNMSESDSWQVSGTILVEREEN